MNLPEVEVSRFTLANGLVLLVAEQHYAEVVSVQAWCQTGSIHEGRWLGAGLTHLLEHMLFKGTENRTAQQISEEIHQVGGYLNAYTTFDRTVFWIDSPASGLRVSLEVLADMLFRSKVDSEELKREMDVVRRELEMGFDDPERTLSQLTFETAFQVHPCRLPVIGIRDIFDQLTPETVRSYYRNRYRPNNVFLVVSGDVNAEEVYTQAERYFGTIKPGPVEAIVVPEEPPQLGRRETSEIFDSGLGYFSLAWHIPPVFSREMPSLDVLSVLLGSGASSLLYEELREKAGLVYGIGCFSYTPSFPGILTVSGSCAPESLNQIEPRIKETMERWRKSLLSAGDLEKAKRIILVNALDQLQTVKGLATDLGLNWLYTRNPAFSHHYLQSIDLVEPEAVRSVYDRYLTEENLTVTSLQPKGLSKPVVRAPKAPSTPELCLMPNGLRVILIPDERLPLLTASFVFRGGVLIESHRTNGLSRWYAQSLTKGSKSKTAAEIAREIEGLGGVLFGDSGYNSFRVAVGSMVEDFDRAFDLLADVLTEPSFPEEAIEREREGQLAAILQDESQPTVVARNRLRAEMYGKHPYGMNLLGSRKSVEGLTRDQLFQTHHQSVSVANGILAICGRFDRTALLSLVERRLGGIPAGSRAKHSKLPAIEPFATKTVVHRDTRHQAVVMTGYLACSVYDPDRVAFELLDEATGDSSSRFFVKVREELGLAYSVGTSLMLGLAPGLFGVYASTAPEVVDQVAQLCREETDELASGALTEGEFERAKTKLLAQLAFQKQGMDAYAHGLALNELYGLGIDYLVKRQQQIEQATIENVRAVCRKYLMDKPSITVIVRP